MPIFPAFFHEQSKKVGEPEQEMPGAIEQIGWRSHGFRMIFLIVARFAVAIAAENDLCFIEFSSGDMMPFEASPVSLAADYATRFIRPEALQGVLPALLAFQFFGIHDLAFLVRILAFGIIEFAVSDFPPLLGIAGNRVFASRFDLSYLAGSLSSRRR